MFMDLSQTSLYSDSVREGMFCVMNESASQKNSWGVALR